VGYDIVDKVLHGDLVLQTIVVLAVLKLVATALSYGSGNAGGIFGPSLFIGAMIGGAVGSVAHALFPGYTAGPGAYALVGMGTAFAGIIRTPLTSVIMIFELTRDYSIIVPLMISNLIAFYISYKLQKDPIYEALAHQDGVHLPSAGSRSPGRHIRVEQAMRAAPAIFSPETSIGAAAERVRDSELDAWPVADKVGLWGMITKAKLEGAVAHGLADNKLSELLSEGFPRHLPDADEFPHVHVDHDLSLAIERMGATGVNVLPVVSRANLRRLMGVVTLEDLLRAYGVAKAEPATASPDPAASSSRPPSRSD
jgi:CIC family chloride channel protein